MLRDSERRGCDRRLRTQDMLLAVALSIVVTGAGMALVLWLS
jgi:hypothetical protein